jgi:hypothetical protein
MPLASSWTFKFHDNASEVGQHIGQDSDQFGREGQTWREVTHTWREVFDPDSNSLGFPKPAGPRPETQLAGYKLNAVIYQTFP